LSLGIFQQLANSFKGGHVDGNSVVKRACHGVVMGWVTSWEVSPVRREVLHQPYLVKVLPPGPQRYQAGVPARDWGGGRCHSGVQGVAAMRGRAVTLRKLVKPHKAQCFAVIEPKISYTTISDFEFKLNCGGSFANQEGNI